MIVGTTGRPLEKTIGEMKSFTSRNLRKAIEGNPGESRKKWITEMMKQTGLDNTNNNDWQDVISFLIMHFPESHRSLFLRLI